MSQFVTEAEVSDLVGRAVEQLHGDIAENIARAMRLYNPRDETPAASITASYGNVVNVYPGYADVQMDTDTITSAVQVLGTVAVGQRVCVLHIPPAGSIIIASGGPGVSTGGGVGGAIVLWELPGPVIPVDQLDSPAIPIVASGTISAVTLSLVEAPAAGSTCVVDVFLNGVSLFVTKPTLNATETLGTFALPAAVAVSAGVDVVTAAVLTPAGRTLTIALS